MSDAPDLAFRAAIEEVCRLARLDGWNANDPEHVPPFVRSRLEEIEATHAVLDAAEVARAAEERGPAFRLRARVALLATEAAGLREERGKLAGVDVAFVERRREAAEEAVKRLRTELRELQAEYALALVELREVRAGLVERDALRRELDAIRTAEGRRAEMIAALRKRHEAFEDETDERWIGRLGMMVERATRSHREIHSLLDRAAIPNEKPLTTRNGAIAGGEGRPVVDRVAILFSWWRSSEEARGRLQAAEEARRREVADLRKEVDRLTADLAKSAERLRIARAVARSAGWPVDDEGVDLAKIARKVSGVDWPGPDEVEVERFGIQVVNVEAARRVLAEGGEVLGVSTVPLVSRTVSELELVSEGVVATTEPGRDGVQLSPGAVEDLARTWHPGARYVEAAREAAGREVLGGSAIPLASPAMPLEADGWAEARRAARDLEPQGVPPIQVTRAKVSACSGCGAALVKASRCDQCYLKGKIAKEFAEARAEDVWLHDRAAREWLAANPSYVSDRVGEELANGALLRDAVSTVAAEVEARKDTAAEDTGEKDTGTKDDAGKPDWSLMPWKGLDLVLAVIQDGAGRYGPNNWRKVRGARQRYANAAMRHLRAWFGGEELDHRSGLPHLAHAISSLLFILEGPEDP